MIQELCHSETVYGTGAVTEAGNALGYLVKQPYCYWTSENPLGLQAGDTLKLNAQYGQHSIPGGHDYHAGVMGLLLMLADDKGASEAFMQEQMNQLAAAALTYSNPVPEQIRDRVFVDLFPMECYKCYSGLMEIALYSEEIDLPFEILVRMRFRELGANGKQQWAAFGWNMNPRMAGTRAFVYGDGNLEYKVLDSYSYETNDETGFWYTNGAEESSGAATTRRRLTAGTGEEPTGW